MSRLEFDFGWLDLDGQDDLTVKSTFAKIRILVGDHCVTTVEDRKARTVRDFIIAPLYPLAEWLVDNWWFLTEECSSGDDDSDEYLQRHALPALGDGYPLPRLAFYPDGEQISLRWRPWRGEHCTVSFLQGGSACLPGDQVRSALGDLVDSVVARLGACDIADSWLQKEWAVIQNTSPEEAEYCRASAWLGLDPYAVADDEARQVLDAWNSVCADLRNELFAATNIMTLLESASWVERGFEKLQTSSTGTRWREIGRQIVGGSLHPDMPWIDGYGLANRLRVMFQLEDKVPLELGDVGGQLFPVVNTSPPPARSLQGLLAFSEKLDPYCYTHKQPNTAAGRFLLARSIWWVCSAGTPKPFLLSSAGTARQKRSRAFAAELLAPAGLIRKRISGSSITDDAIEELGEEFRVSSYVIRHQIENHDLATVVNLDAP